MPVHLLGQLVLQNANGDVLGNRTCEIYANNEIIIGRDRTRCQYVIDDPRISKKHLRVYAVIYDNEEASQVDPLVYAEDLSTFGTFWNASLIGRGNGGVLLSDGDKLRLCPNIFMVFNPHSKADDTPLFNYDQEREMSQFRDHYVLTDRLLGAGAFGRVLMGIDQRTRSQLACKVVDLRPLKATKSVHIGRIERPAPAEDVDSRVQLRKIKEWAYNQGRGSELEEGLKVYYREVEILGSISHPNIVGIEKAFVTDTTMYIFQDLVTAGDLFSYIEANGGSLDEVASAVVVRQVLIALRYLHQHNIVHRDLKPDNVLMTSMSAGCRVVLTDFGAARRIENPRQRMSTMAGTEEYTAPEVRNRTAQLNPKREAGYTTAVDLWSLGCIVVVLLTGGSAFNDPTTNTYSEQLASECNLDFLRQSPEWQHVRRRPTDFVERLLVLDETQRMTAEDALSHPWFSNEMHRTNFEDLYERTIRHWHPRPRKSPVIEFIESNHVKYLPCSTGFVDNYNKGRDGGHLPVEPPYKPFPRKMHLKLWPKRKTLSRARSEVTAINDNWRKNMESSPTVVIVHKDPNGRDIAASKLKPMSTVLSKRKAKTSISKHMSPVDQGNGRDKLTSARLLDAGQKSTDPACAAVLSSFRSKTRQPVLFAKHSKFAPAYESRIPEITTLKANKTIPSLSEGKDPNLPDSEPTYVAEKGLARVALPLPSTNHLLAQIAVNAVGDSKLMRRKTLVASGTTAGQRTSRARRSAVFEIQADPDSADDELPQAQSFKRQKTTSPLNAEFCDHENSLTVIEPSEETEVTVPHHVSTISGLGCGELMGYPYLPR